MNDKETFKGCSKYIDGQGWVVQIPVSQLEEKGYRKIPENAVVLTREEFDETLKDKLKQARKETAEKYHNEIELWIKTCMCMHYISLEHGQALLNDNNKFAKQFGVEIKE